MRVLAVLLSVASIAILACAGALKVFQRRFDKRADRIHASLEKHGEGTFDPAALAGLPEPVRRYFTHAIAEGTPLAASADLRLGGTLRTAPEAPPILVSAEERIAPPFGYVWRVRFTDEDVAGTESYFDGKAAVRYVKNGFLPASQDGDDLDRSSRARLALESVLLPSSLLPLRGVEWESVDSTHLVARMVIDRADIELKLEIDENGRLLRAVVDRPIVLSGPRGYVTVPFVLEAHEERTMSGFTIPIDFSLVAKPPDRPEIEVARPHVLDFVAR